MKQLFLLSLLALVLGSCTKDDYFGTGNILPRGNVLEAGTDVPIPNALVGLFEPTGGLFSAQQREIATTRTDENGYFEFDVEPDNSYRLDARAEGYYDLDTPNGMDVSLRRFDGKLRLIPNAYLLIEVENVPPQDGLDRIAINRTNCTPKNEALIGAEVNETVFCDFESNTEHKVTWFVSNGGGEYIRYDTTLFFPAHDTVRLTIQY
ncbi:MAG: carboxypeptidase-like regulatory domain-containing protein [Bacteroidota bacterium]